MDQLQAILSHAHAQFTADPCTEVIDWLAKELGTTFDHAAMTGELEAFQALCRAHPLSDLLMLDPYSRRAVDKPRGYAGDAVMLDYIYRPSRPSLDGVASIVHSATTSLPNAKSILWRRDYIATMIYNCMRKKECPEVMSVAAGHMRELDALRDMTADTNVTITALDQDSDSLREAKQTYHEFNILARPKSVTSLLRRAGSRDRFDLIYSAGLFDYLSDALATSIIKAMYARLKPGGFLSVGNFTCDSHGRGFMAGFMDWCLIYRNEEQMRALADAACPKASQRIFRDQPGNVIYLELFAE